MTALIGQKTSIPPKTNINWEDGDVLFSDHIPWSVTALAGRPHKNVKPGRTVRAVEGLVGCPDGRLPRVGERHRAPGGFSCSSRTRSPLEVLGGGSGDLEHPTDIATH